LFPVASADVKCFFSLHGRSILLTAENSSFSISSLFRNSILNEDAFATVMPYPVFIVSDGIGLNLTLAQSRVTGNTVGVRIDLSENEYGAIVDTIDASSASFLPATFFAPGGSYPITIECKF
jgi:hypothetical protein